MTDLRPPQPPPELEALSSLVKMTINRPPGDFFSLDDNIPFHATRLLLLIRLAGKPQNNPQIEGRTKLAKLDFFVRYPQFLERAAKMLLTNERFEQIQSILDERPTVESHMIRYKYGPWDKKYYLVLSYLTGKKLIAINPIDKIDHYQLTETGYTLTTTLMAQQEFFLIRERCRIVGELFSTRGGNWLKSFIYRYFPEVVRTPYTQIIPLLKEDESVIE